MEYKAELEISDIFAILFSRTKIFDFPPYRIIHGFAKDNSFLVAVVVWFKVLT